MRISDWSSDVCSSDLDDEKKRARETGEDAQAVPFLKRFTVFNAQQCENLPEELAVVAPPPLPGLIEPRIEALIAATGIDFRIGGNRAYYAPGPDYVMVPPPQAFRSEEHTSELQSLMRISYAVFCLKQTKTQYETNRQSKHNI